MKNLSGQELKRIELYKQAILNIKAEKYTHAGMCFLLTRTQSNMGLSFYTKIDWYRTDRCGIEEYSLFFEKDQSYLPEEGNWEIRQTILEFMIAMVELGC